MEDGMKYLENFVLTNKLMPKSNTGTVIIPDSTKSAFTNLNSNTEVVKKIKFTTLAIATRYYK